MPTCEPANLGEPTLYRIKTKEKECHIGQILHNKPPDHSQNKL